MQPMAERFTQVGLVKPVGQKNLEDNHWSQPPGRYVGVDLAEDDEDFDFEETLREIQEAVELAVTIASNFEEVGL